MVLRDRESSSTDLDVSGMWTLLDQELRLGHVRDVDIIRPGT